MSAPRTPVRRREAAVGPIVNALAFALLALLVLPVVGLVGKTSAADFAAGLRHPLVRPALELSLVTTLISLALAVTTGTALAWLLAARDGRLYRTIETLIELPIVIPPAVAGVALLLAFGRRGLLAPLFPGESSLAFSTTAVVIAQLFVSAPLFVKAAVSAFRGLDPELLLVARSLGARRARVFFRIALPLAFPGLLSGAALCWARSLGEFGATLMFAGNLTGRTQTLPLAIYTALESDVRAAQALSLVLLAIACALLLALRVAFARLYGAAR
jgi:molybdate transport system permease protein